MMSPQDREQTAGTYEEYDVQVGRVLGPHGLRGLVRVFPLTDIPNRHKTLKQVFGRLASGEGAGLLTVEQAVPTRRGLWLVKFVEIEDRTAAEKLRGAGLYVREEDVPPLPEGSYYIHQIIGLQVRTVEGRELGPVTEVWHTGANDVYETPSGLLPATEEVIKEINLEAGYMIVAPLPGMIDEPDEE